MEFDQRSEHGSIRVTVSPLPANPEKPRVQAGGSCFVATACFGDPKHPTVIALQSFRDDVLVRSSTGRVFVASYYRVGPALAKALNKLPFLKPVTGRAITALAILLRERS